MARTSRTTRKADAKDPRPRKDDTGRKTARETTGEDSGSPAMDLVLGPGIDPDVEKRVKKHAESFKESFRRTVEEAWHLGGALQDAKDQVSHGQWLPWLQVQIGLEPRTAQRLMAFRHRYPELRLVSHFGSVSEGLRTLPPGPKSDKKDGRGRADSVRAASESAEEKTGVTSPTGAAADAARDRDTDTVGTGLPAIVKQLELILERTPLEAGVQRVESHLQALVRLTLLAGAAVNTCLSASDEASRALEDGAVAKIVDVLKGIARGRQDTEVTVPSSADDSNGDPPTDGSRRRPPTAAGVSEHE